VNRAEGLRHHLGRIIEAAWLLAVLWVALALADRDGHLTWTDVALALPIIAAVALAHRATRWLWRRRRA
jgi:hypothetical protein